MNMMKMLLFLLRVIIEDSVLWESGCILKVLWQYLYYWPRYRGGGGKHFDDVDEREENDDVDHEGQNEGESAFGNLRKARPYYFTFTTHAKGRWVGESPHSVYSREFRALPAGELDKCIEAGLVRVNGNMSRSYYLVGNNDFISHMVQRHELPVTSSKVKVVAETEDLVVVDKPASIPVHPCGRYRHNTVPGGLT